MVKNELYEQEIKRISPRLEELKGQPFDEMMWDLYYEVSGSKITRDLIFALTYVLDPSRFFIEIGLLSGRYTIEFTADTPLECLGTFAYINTWSDKRPTDGEARDIMKEWLDDDKGGLKVEGLIEKACGVVDTCKIKRVR